jgi:hypothetical protein
MPGCGADDTNPEMPFRISDDLCIGGMISRFNSNNSAADCWVPFANIFGDSIFAPDGPRIRISPASMPGRHLGVQDDLLGAGETEVEYPGPEMVEPDDCMEVLLHHVIAFIGELNQRVQLLIFGRVAPCSSDFGARALIVSRWGCPEMTSL